MSGRTWGISPYGAFSYVSLTQELLPKTLELLRPELFAKDHICLATELHNNPEAIHDLDKLVIKIAKDGVSLVAIDNFSKKVIGCLLNKIQVKYENLFEDTGCTHASAQTYLNLLSILTNDFDVFKHFGTNCYFENVFLVMLPSFQRGGIEEQLVKYSVSIAQELKCNNNVRVPLDGVPSSLNDFPTTIIASTTKWTDVYNRCGYSKFDDIVLLPSGPGVNATKLKPVSILFKNLTP